jgi:hypothetical protein
MSILDRFNVASSISCRCITNCGSTFSIHGMQFLGSSVSIFNYFAMGSTFSCRSVARMGD